MSLPPADLALSRLPQRAPPTRLSALLFDAKIWAFRVQHLLTAPRLSPLAKGEPAHFPQILAQSRTQLWSDPRPAERAAQQGKVQNLRLAAAAFDRLVMMPGETFSFWRQLGRASRRRGFVNGRMLKEGCMVSAVGGGLCQLSNALYAVALDSGCEIVERHGHSRIVEGSQAAFGRDATIAWNYVDLRFRAPRPTIFRVSLTAEELVVELRTAHGESRSSPAGEAIASASTCATCARTDCFRHEHDTAVQRAAFLTDEDWPEFGAYLAIHRAPDDIALSAKRGAPLATILRGLAQRRAKTAPARRAAELNGNARIANHMARKLTPDVTAVTVAQSLLPALWRNGHLAGRRFTVLMTRMPMAEIQIRLDTSARRHPERASLQDFRADPELLVAEAQALAAADGIVTAHPAIARLLAARAVLLDWHKPSPRAVRAATSRRIAFPGPTVARKGAYELREAARALDLEVVLAGSELEGADFWNGIRIMRADPANWLDGVACVVQPALLEDAPRKLLDARAAGVPVIATAACGIDDAIIVPEDDATALVAAISSILVPPPHPVSPSV